MLYIILTSLVYYSDYARSVAASGPAAAVTTERAPRGALRNAATARHGAGLRRRAARFQQPVGRYLIFITHYLDD